MKKINVTAQDRDVASFFAENSILQKKFTSGAHNLSVDGTGKDVSVGETVGRRISEYICEKFVTDDKLCVVDLGTGRAHLPNQMDKLGIDAYGFEGAGELVGQGVYNKNKVACCDLSVPFTDERLNKAFHLSTSFELLEHIHRDHEDQFLKNLAYLSDYHLCSINVDGWPGVSSTHCNIKHPCCWGETFRKHGIECDFIGAAPKARPDPAWAKKGFIPKEYAPGADNEEFRDNVRFGQWDEWKFSIFCLLDLRGCK